MIIRDLTERKKAEEALQDSETQLRQAMDAVNAGSWKVNIMTGEFIASDRARELHGLAPGMPMTHERAMACVCPEDRAKVEAAFQSTVENGEVFNMEYRVSQPDGSIRWVASYAEHFNDGDQKWLVGLVQGITERKRAEDKIQNLLEKEQQFTRNFKFLMKN